MKGDHRFPFLSLITVSLRFLLINPWIVDTAAYNFWIRPLGLYALAQWIAERGGECVFIDCLSPARAPGRFPVDEVPTPECVRAAGLRRRFRRYGIGLDQFMWRLKGAGRVNAVLVTSAMSYWYPGVQMVIELVRKVMPGVPVILGGVYPTLWPVHAKRHSLADHVIQGPLERVQRLLAGLLKLPEAPVRQARPWYRLGLHDQADFSAIRTASGCPFRCSYCASRLVSGPFRPRRPKDILEEIQALYGMGVRQVCFYDDALLVDFDTRLGPVLEDVKARGMDMVFHTPNAMHASLVDRHVASLLFMTCFRTLRISLETVDRTRQQKSGGKVASSDVEVAVRYFTEAGYRPEEIGVYLLAALPGQDIHEVRAGIEFVKAMGAKPYIAEMSPIPGTGTWHEFRQMGLVHDDMDPLLTNNSLFYQWSGFCTQHEFQKLRAMCA